MRVVRRLLPVVAVLLLLSVALHAEVVGSKNSKKYHRPTCQWAQKIKPENKVVFKDAKEAKQAGYRACKVCKPSEK